MINPGTPKLSLEQAKLLVSHLEKGDEQSADELLLRSIPESIGDELTVVDSSLFEEIGKLTRQLHTALADFQLDPRLTDLAQQELPDAESRLNYVISMTENAANRTMDAVEASLPIADNISTSVKKILPDWDSLLTTRISISQFKAMCHELQPFLQQTEVESDKLRSMLTDVLMAQDYQDLTGQVIRRVIELVKEVEDNLITLLRAFGTPMAGIELVEEQVSDEPVVADKVEPAELPKAEGPIIDAENRDDVVQGQDDVDDLLSSLGF